MNSKEIFMSAITDDKGAVNVGYLVLLRSGQVCAGVIITMVVGSILEFWFGTERPAPRVFNILALGQGIGFVLAAYAALLGGIATFLWGDSKQNPPTSFTKQVTDTTITSTPPVAPTLPVA